MAENGIRINKYISECGICSRRRADVLIVAGQVRINDEVVSAGARVYPGDRVYVEDKPVELQKEKVVLAFYKPRGIVCSADGQGAKTVFEFMNYPEKLFYVGRLDKDSEGLLLLTNDGELDQAISRARNQHEKEYEVIVDHPVTRKFVQQMEKGVPILDTVTRPCKVRQKGERAFTIILTQGLNRQIRRMCEYCGYRVRRLKRVRIMNIRLGEMQPGQYRELSRQELEELRDLL